MPLRILRFPFEYVSENLSENSHLLYDLELTYLSLIMLNGAKGFSNLDWEIVVRWPFLSFSQERLYLPGSKLQ